ncbi:alpha/beta hydrolase fold domain-containing protein [Corynebacterium poyangense]|uniref:Alpha/beta hydrolase fold domain-containing protein n=1 Tax=Corynebacterium poyangense TaxID=2684405 RepID=A0A7H0SLA9_9CORY|nr:alpha/beta hydrolase fold domain-containing protein [Corynebacterium poyangense]MBZ8177425.1 alpha/beta hydrolase fold domain-containing protein [Corynebacterium poyangense]QNQ89334.1 alpha/beta hydrolase fold domain-containing protein [Corynebacterium poyangense]
MSEQPRLEEKALLGEAEERAAFQVGGREEKLNPVQQLAQIGTYVDAHHPMPELIAPWVENKQPSSPAEAVDNYLARLPDRLTHSAMLMLGSGLDHSMPGVSFLGNIQIETHPDINSTIMLPSNPNGHWAISLHGGQFWFGSGSALEFQWQPEIAGLAERSGTTIIDVDYPLAPSAHIDEMLESVAAAAAYACANTNFPLSLVGFEAGAALAVLSSRHINDVFGADTVEKLALMFPDFSAFAELPERFRGSYNLPAPEHWPHTFWQIAGTEPTRVQGLAGSREVELPPHVRKKEYVSRQWISTPEVARERIADLAEFLRNPVEEQGNIQGNITDSASPS